MAASVFSLSFIRFHVSLSESLALAQTLFVCLCVFAQTRPVSSGG